MPHILAKFPSLEMSISVHLVLATKSSNRMFQLAKRQWRKRCRLLTDLPRLENVAVLGTRGYRSSTSTLQKVSLITIPPVDTDSESESSESEDSDESAIDFNNIGAEDDEEWDLEQDEFIGSDDDSGLDDEAWLRSMEEMNGDLVISGGRLLNDTFGHRSQDQNSQNDEDGDI